MSWKTFKFFEYEDVKDPETNEPFDKLKARDERFYAIACYLSNAHRISFFLDRSSV